MSDSLSAIRIAAFDREQGGNPVLDPGGAWWLYENGACRECDPLGALIPPPQDDYERLTNITLYHRACLSAAVRRFDDLKASLESSAGWGDDALAELKRRQAVVSAMSENLKKAQSELEKNPRWQMINHHKGAQAYRQQEHAAQLAKLRAINI